MKSLLFILTFAGFIWAANDSTTTYDTVYTLNWKRCVMGFQFDTGSKNVTIVVPPDYMPWLSLDTANGITMNIYGANNIWKKAKQLTDSIGTYSAKDLFDSLRVHAGKYLKKQTK
jgi:hypothetical protein